MRRSRPTLFRAAGPGLALLAALASLALVVTTPAGSADAPPSVPPPAAPAQAAPDAPPPAAAAPAAPALPAPVAGRLEEIRREAGQLYREQTERAWATRTRGEESRLAQSYLGHDSLFSRETVAFVRGLADSAADPGQRQALRFLEFHLAAEAVRFRTAGWVDELVNREAGARVSVPGWNEPQPYRRLGVLLAGEADPTRRAALQAAREQVWRDELNPILARRQAAEDSLIRDLGYPDYVTFSQAFRGVQCSDLLREAFAFVQATNPMYRTLLREQAQVVLGVGPEALRRADIDRLDQSPALAGFFPRELVVPAFDEFLAGLGLNRYTLAGTEIRIDDADRPGKNPRAACIPVDVPSDVRVSLTPRDGLPGFETFFHEMGHALFFGNVSTPTWEFRELGNSAGAEGISCLFTGLWSDPAWLRHYREFVRARAGAGSKVPVMTDLDIARTVRRGIFWNIYMVRRYAAARVLFESILHDGDPGIYTPYLVPRPGDDLQEKYRQIFGLAYGFHLTPNDALRFRTDTDPFFYAADYARGYELAGVLDEAFSARFGAPWFLKPAAGAFLKAELFAPGTRLQPEDAAKAAGAAAFSFEPLQRRLMRLYQESDAILEGAR